MRKGKKEQGGGEVKTSYKASFTVPGNGVHASDSTNGIVIDGESGGVLLDLPYSTEQSYIGDIDYEIEFTVNEMDYVKGAISFRNKAGFDIKFEMDGFFTCVQDIKVEMSANKVIPVWGTWTDKDICAAVPRMLKDHEKRRTQLAAREKDPSAKVDTLLYNNGKWLALNKGKKIEYAFGTQTPLDPKNTPYTYEMVEIKDKAILYEKGVEKPDPKSVRDKAGVWYEFTLAKGEYVDKKDDDGNIVRDDEGNPEKEFQPPEVGGYTWERLTVDKDGTAVALSGSAEMIDHFGEKQLSCSVVKRITYDATGKAAEEKYGLEKDADGNETPIDDYAYEEIAVRWSDYDKGAGTIKLNGGQFYKVSKAALNGTWSTHKKAPPLPGASKADARGYRGKLRSASGVDEFRQREARVHPAFVDVRARSAGGNRVVQDHRRHAARA